jgi:uncharacterized protein (TIGR02266 family)
VAPINSVRIRLRYLDLGTFVEKFAPNVTRGGVFLASRNIAPVGAVIPFEIQLMNGDVVLAGQGKVSWVKEWSAAEPNRPYGMGVQFISVDPATKPILARLLRARETGGLAPRRALTTAEFSPIGAAAGAARTAGVPNGKPIAPPIDTSVDLAAEYGLADTVVRRVIDRTWMTGMRGADDLADLLKPEPVETITLAQALADLPRLLDPQYSRRRAAGGFRSGEGAGVGLTGAPASAPVTDAASENTLQEGTDESDSIDVNLSGLSDAPDAATTDAAEASDTTDMTGTRDTVDSMQAVTAEADPGPGNNGRRAGKRRR